MPFYNKKEMARRATVSKAQQKRWEGVRRVKAIKEELVPVINEVGRRVIDLQLFARQMWCDECDVPLSLRFLEEERRFGLACKFFVRCHQCLERKEVFTSDTVPRTSDDGSQRALYAINCKTAIGCVDSGVGHEQLNKLLSAMNVPTIHANTIVRAERRVGPSIVEVAEQSCRDAIMEEKELTLRARRQSTSSPAPSGHQASSTPIIPQRSNATLDSSGTPRARTEEEMDMDMDIDLDTSLEDPVEIVCMYDFGWDKRGSGFTYNSHSGRGSLCGKETGKLMASAHMCNYCAMCARGHEPDDHDCAKNYEGSSKGMEPAAAVKMILNNPNLKAANVKVAKLVGDRDSSTMAALRRAGAEIEKLLDLNHNLKSGVNNPMYDLKLKKGFKFLTKPIIEHIKRCVTYAIHQNKDDVEGVRSAILNVSPHLYGEHNGCGAWCQAKEDPDYVMKKLPDGKPLSCPDFRVALDRVLKSQADDAEMLAPCGSSLVNESFNHMVNTRAPKSRFYCGTNANLYRVSSAVCNKNIGAECIDKIFEHANLSPSCTDYRKKLQATKEQHAAHKSKPDVKKRRLFLKNKTNWKDASDNSKGGLTYVSGMSNTMERAAAAATAVTAPTQSWLPPPATLQPSCKFVIVDTETAGFLATDSLIQIAAKCGDKTFSANMLPASPIEPRAAAVNGLKVKNGKLWRHGVHLPTVSDHDACQSFLAFLKECSDQVVLVGHNIRRFDAPRLLRLLNIQCVSKDFCEIVLGLVDTVPLIQQGKMKKQDLLAKTYLTGAEWEPLLKGAHDALGDCILLDGLLQHFQVTEEVQKKNIYTMREFMERQIMLKNKNKILPSLAPLKEFGVTKYMIEKMAESGVTLAELQREYDAYGRKGIEVCLGVQVNGKARVTTKKESIDNVEKYFVKPQATSSASASV